MHRLFLVCAVIAIALGVWVAWPGAGSGLESAPGLRRGEAAVVPGSARAVDIEFTSGEDPGVLRERAESEAVAGDGAEWHTVTSAGATIDVQVVNDSTDAPAPGVRVDVAVLLAPNVWTFATDTVVTDALGRARLAVPSGSELRVNVVEDAAHRSSPILLAGLAPNALRSIVLRVEIAQARTFHGRVVAEEDGAPIGGAQILRVRADVGSSVFAENPLQSICELVATTDSDGGFVFEETSLRPSGLAVLAPGFAVLPFNPDPGHETPDRARRLELLRFASLVVTIPDAHGERVEVTLEAYSVRREWQYGVTDIEGRCVFENVWPHKEIDVELARSNGTIRRIPYALTLDPGETREVTWTLGDARIYGSVARTDGTPLTHAEVWLLEPFGPQGAGGRRLLHRDDDEHLVARTQLSGDGTFELQGVAAGTYWIGVPPTGFGRDEYSLAHLITVPSDAHELRVDLEVERGAFLRGLVVTPDGAPVHDARVRTPFDVLGARSAATNHGGAFRLGPMPAGAYTLIARGRGGETSVPVLARTGDEDVVIELRPGALVRGSVIDAATGKLARAQYGMYSIAGERGFGTTQDGSFEQRLVPGSYFLVATTEDGRVSSPLAFDVAAGQELSGLEARLEPGGRLRITSSFPPSLARVRWNGRLVAETVAAPNQLQVLTVPLGDVTVELRHGEEILATADATVGADEVTEVVLAP